jgi:hypothetical protein
MTFSKSNLNILPESLFTELTAYQAQMLEGGKRVIISKITCIKPGDLDGTDELFFRINGKDLGRNNPLKMSAGTTRNVSAIADTFDNLGFRIQLLDAKNDGGVLMVGNMSVSGISGDFLRRTKFSGGVYDVTYSVTN